ncbi:hypothetical protein ACFOLG_16160 [Vogesella facilis]|uniref:Uncharacterized protein n=1 Tax=Vogesella facilis TaxID=1655232 RepID=A0ABV7RHE5_9NEIS
MNIPFIIFVLGFMAVVSIKARYDIRQYRKARQQGEEELQAKESLEHERQKNSREAEELESIWKQQI